MSVRAACRLAHDAVEAPRPEDPVTGDDAQVSRARVLGKVRHRRRAAHRARCGQGLAGEHLGEGGLAGPVAPDEADPVPGRDLEGHRLEELATAGGELEVGGSDHGGPVLLEPGRCGGTARSTAWVTSNEVCAITRPTSVNRMPSQSGPTP